MMTQIKFEKDKVFTISPLEIKVSDDLPRYRKDMGDVAELAASITSLGQIQPIVVNENLELIAGGRRLAACVLGNIDVKYIYMTDLEPSMQRMVEIEENVRRKAFTPAEEAFAIQEYHEHKVKEYGLSKRGKKEGWSLADTAKALGISKTQVSREMDVARHLAIEPELADAKNKLEIRRSIDKRRKLLCKALDLATREADNCSQLVQTSNIVFQGDGLIHLSKMKAGSVDVLLTDPPYGINIDKQNKQLNEAGFTFDDSLEGAIEIYTRLAKESFRACSPVAHAVVFCSVEMFYHAQISFEAVGWDCWPRPFIWIKAETGRTNNPDRWPASCYEVALFARKEKATLNNYPMPDWVRFPPVLGACRTHPTEKPVELLEWILDKVAFPYAKVVDPFAGSFSAVEAALNLGLNVEGCDMLTECYVVGTSRINILLEKRDARNVMPEDEKETCPCCGKDEDEVSIGYNCESCGNYVCHNCIDTIKDLCADCDDTLMVEDE